MNGFRTLSRAMLLGFFRDRMALFFTILFPLMFLFLFGGLFKDSGVPKVKVIEVGTVQVLDQAVAADSGGQLRDVMEVQKADDLDAALRKVRNGDVAAAVEQQGDQVKLHYSAADRVRSGTVQSILTSLVQQANVPQGVPPKLTLTGEQVEDKSLNAIQYFTPGLLGWAVATSATFGAAMTLVAWRRKRILRRLRLSPVRTSSVVTARVGVSMLIAAVQMVVFIGLATMPYFGLKLSHQWWLSIPLVFVGTLAFLSIGLLAGAVAKTEEAANGIAQLIVLPMAFLSGSFFPLDAAPAWLRTVAQIFPLRHLNDAMLDVMVRGKGLPDILPQLGILAAFAVVLTAIASRLFTWDDV